MTMDRKFTQQLVVFAAVFLCLQLVFDLMQDIAITPGVFLSRLITTLVATAFYGLVTWWLKKRKNSEE